MRIYKSVTVAAYAVLCLAGSYTPVVGMGLCAALLSVAGLYYWRIAYDGKTYRPEFG